MVFKRRQQATARTARGGGGESRGYCAQWARQLHSSVKIKQVEKPPICETAVKETLEYVQLIVIFSGRSKCFLTPSEDSSADDRRVGGYGEKRGSRVACASALKKLCFSKKQIKRRRIYLIGCLGSCSWHRGLWLNCEVKKKGLKLSQEE